MHNSPRGVYRKRQTYNKDISQHANCVLGPLRHFFLNRKLSIFFRLKKIYIIKNIASLNCKGRKPTLLNICVR